MISTLLKIIIYSFLDNKKKLKNDEKLKIEMKKVDKYSIKKKNQNKTGSK